MPERISEKEAEDLLVKLVETPSVSGNEQECAGKLIEFFEKHGREAWIDSAGNVRSPGNGVLLTSHIDTVPGNPEVKKEEGYLHGRGTVDATGPLVAMAVAAVETGASFAGVVREETDSRGAEYLIEDRKEPDFLVNGEPTGADGIALGYRGSINGSYRVRKELFHSSRPELNAIQEVMDEWMELENNFPGEGFDSVLVKPSSIEGGTEGSETFTNVDFQVRVPPSREIDRLKQEIEASLSGKVRWVRSVPAVIESPRSELARVFRSSIRESGMEPRMVKKTGTCDMNRYSGAWECPMVTYGPGDSELDHTPREKIELEEFYRSIEVLINAVEGLNF